jgi:hypothetical protein
MLTDQQMLDEARVALHRFQIGGGIVECEFGGQRTKFSAGNIEKLVAYIAQLEAKIAGLPQRGAIGFYF